MRRALLDLRKGDMTVKRNILLAGLLLAGGGARAHAIDLQGATVEAWQEYLRSTDERMQARVEGKAPFLWAEESSDRVQRIKRGETIVAPLAGHGTQTVRDGLIHHWIGAVFIPDATIDSLLAVVHDYDRYREIYKPVVKVSKSISADENAQEFSMIWERHVVFVKAAVQGRYRARDFALDAHRGYSVIETTRMQEIEDYRHAGERLLPPDTGGGFIWRIHTITRYVQRDGGVYLEIEAMLLSRDIPASVRWLAVPIINRLSVSSLATTLAQTREVVAVRNVSRTMRGNGRNLGTR